jgi:hypothetical protein
MLGQAKRDVSTKGRDYNRYERRLEGQFLVEGGRWGCWIRNLSLGGAGLEPAIQAALGKTVALSSPFFDFEDELTGRVVNICGNRTCLACDIDEGHQAPSRQISDGKHTWRRTSLPGLPCARSTPEHSCRRGLRAHLSRCHVVSPAWPAQVTNRVKIDAKVTRIPSTWNFISL